LKAIDFAGGRITSGANDHFVHRPEPMAFMRFALQERRTCCIQAQIIPRRAPHPARESAQRSLPASRPPPKSVPALVLDGLPFHINFGADLSDLK
jgi:hypothetical protein